MSRARQQRHSEDMRNRILAITQKIIAEEGSEALSIRRVAGEMDYSAAILYRYFRDKEELLLCCARECYRKILDAVEPTPPDLAPDEALRVSFRNFANSALQVPNEYRAFILNLSPELREETAVLGESGIEKRPTLALIVEYLEAGIATGIFAPCDAKLTARVFWTAGFGLFFRLIVEPDVLPKTREALIERYLEILLKGIEA